MVNVDHDVWSIPEESLFPILAGELPLPVPRNNYWGFRSVQGQLDDYIVRTLPKEFWGSCFYMDSDKYRMRESPIPNRSEEELKGDCALITELTEKANEKEVDILKFYKKRISKKRAKKTLNAIGKRVNDLVGEEYSCHRVLTHSVLRKAMERMDAILNDISKKKPYRCRSILKSYSVCWVMSIPFHWHIECVGSQKRRRVINDECIALPLPGGRSAIHGLGNGRSHSCFCSVSA